MDGSNWRWGPDDTPDGDPFMPPPPPAGEGPTVFVIFVVSALLIGGGYILAHKLGDMVRIQNCVIQGRTNCAPIEVPKIFVKGGRTATGPIVK